ncbi:MULTISPECIES: FAD binding domain-containing protein [unclassified Paracoccus (in: a-proteobacteria)]|uniref:FAD binding domain-containing protein n=1 Tax=unclassified Paracoccus (in: a-proteobacteria) TaxID=2688777 RepID=UPI0012B3EF09|nr:MULTISPECIES: xanthine dehydrogenase family protein subunit M [unclassified Paracoccus (in: a-proteobacteria)]UXU76598.1 xanthine dehydrogenase family protein subunit M [Paracoccus sp. SMMA_5]UXU82485.1 xanthine dehydrogenase family protein subunit M [Paracoccus sp. SMMA_5_TC]
MRRFEYHEPTTLEEASALLTSLGEGAYLLAGGTDLFVEIREHLRRVSHLVNIKRVPGLDRIEWSDQGGLRFGALVTAGQLEASEPVVKHYPNLRTAMQLLASIQVRNRATVIGNICRASPSADSIPPLIADGASIEIWNPQGGRTVPLAEFFTGPGRSVLQPGEIAVAIAVPPPKSGSGRAYIKHGRRKAMELATVGVAVSLDTQGGECTGARIALGAVGPVVLRAPRAEAILVGSRLDADTIAAAAEQAMQECTPISNVRSSAEYRRDMVGVLTRRAVSLALEEAA